MRMLFNHGMTPAELYTNTPLKICDRKRRWFVKHYGGTQSRGDALANPFKFAIGYILNKMIDEKARFIIPNVSESYWDFKIIADDDFVKARQNGKFQEIDFVNSDFKGYMLYYHFKTKGYQKAYPMYLGGDLKKKFIHRINEGDSFYTTKNLTLKDILPEVYKRFPELTKKEVKSLLIHGFMRMNHCMKFGCAFTINTKKFYNCYVFIGKISLDPENQIKEFLVRRDRKLRKICAWKKEPFDKYYYIGLKGKGFENWLNLNERSSRIVKFENIIARRLLEEFYYRGEGMHIFRIRLSKFKGYAFWADRLEAKKVDYLGTIKNYKLDASVKTWLEIRTENEKIRNK